MGLRGPHAVKKASAYQGRIPRPAYAEPVATADRTAAERNRNYRARQRDGRAIFTVELDRDDVECLFQAGLLDARREWHTREEVAAAIRSYLQISRDA